jgi:hypothetical protein
MQALGPSGAIYVRTALAKPKSAKIIFIKYIKDSECLFQIINAEK